MHISMTILLVIYNALLTARMEDNIIAELSSIIRQIWNLAKNLNIYTHKNNKSLFLLFKIYTRKFLS